MDQRPIGGTSVPALESLPSYNRLLVEAEQAICQIKVMQPYQISTDIASFGCLCWRLAGDVVGCGVGCGVGCAIACKSWTQ